MFKSIKKHQKKLLAVFGVGLMITFVVQTGSSYYGGGGSSNPVVGTVNGEKIYAQEQIDSRRMWDRLKRTGIANLPGVPQGQVASALVLLGDEAAGLINREPDTFLLLQKEAKRMGLAASNDGVEELMHNQRTLNETATVDEVNDLRESFAALLLVKAGYERALSVIKTPDPQKQYDLAMLGQTMKVNYITYDANEFKPSIPPPTPEQLKQQFDKYANELADQPSASNPFGFGYKYPNRVMVEFLTIRRPDLRDAVKKSKDDAAWEVDARKQYYRNAADYPTSRPSKTDNLPVGIAAPASQPTSQPTTKPLAFADYRQQIIDQLLDDAEAKVLEDARKKIATTMQTDWAAYKAAVNPTTAPTSQPAAGPVTSVGVAYGSPEYLAKLALSIQQEFKFLPQVNRFAKDWLTEKDLAGLPGVGIASLESEDPQGQPLTFPEYAIYLLDAFGHQPSPRDPAPTLSVLSPSPALTDFSRNVHFFRVIAADPAHAAKEMTPFSAQLETDYKLAAATDKAKLEADKVLAIAKTSGLDAAAVSAGRKVQSLDRVTARGVAPTNDLTLKPESERELIKAAFDLLKHGDDIKSGKAVAEVQLSRDGKVLLIGPTEIAPVWQAATTYQVESRLVREMSSQLEQQFRVNWFDAKEVERRTQYQPESKKEKSST